MPKKSKRRKHPIPAAHHKAEHHGHHARLRKHHAAPARHTASHAGPHTRRARKKGRRSTAKGEPTKPSAMERLHKAVSTAREQLRSVGARRKHHHSPEKQVTEKTLRDHMALKCVRRCSH